MEHTFRSLLAAAALLTAVGTAGAQPTPMPPPPASLSPAAPMTTAERERIVDAAIAKISAEYVFPKRVPAIARALRTGLSGPYKMLTDQKAFVDAVNRDIEAAAHDRHMQLMWSPDPLPPLPEANGKDVGPDKEFAEFIGRRNYAIRNVQVLDGNVGYLKINGFLPPELAGATLTAAMAFLKNSDALIVDLRDNGGGDPGGVALLVSYLVPPETLINTFIGRDKPAPDQIWSLPYVPGGRWSTDKPVYVLTSKDTASGAEEFAYDLQQLKRGTVIGATTWGGANPGKMVPIDDHFAIFVPFGSAVNPISKTNWEGVGVKPDVAVKPEVALATAHRLALQKLVAGATGPRRAELQSFLDGPVAK